MSTVSLKKEANTITKKIGFDNEKYLKEQTQAILERVK